LLARVAEGPLRGHYRLDAVRAHLLERAGDSAGAREGYLAAAARTNSVPERNYLAMRASRLSGC
jgi:predicted RNA polymerase sigma factor